MLEQIKLLTMLKVIDISDISYENSKKLVEAASTQGFLLLKNHTLDKQTIDSLFRISKQFFDLPFEVKNKYPRTINNDGYIAPMVEDLQQDGTGKGDPKEGFNITHFNMSDFVPHHETFPEVFEENKHFIATCVKKYYEVVHGVCRLLAMGLEVKDEKGNPNSELFVDAHALDLKARSALRLLHYPKPDKSSEDQNLAGAHTDYGSLTFVIQRPHKGLQIFDGSKWVDVDIPEQDGQELLIVNIADMLSFWTDGYLKSTLHRVRSNEERYSVVFFVQPGDAVLLTPVNSEIVKNHPGGSYLLNKNGKPLTSEEHLFMRLDQGYNRKK